MSDTYDQINQYVTRLEKHQRTLQLSDVAFVGKYSRYLGSAKTWKDRLVKRNYAEFGCQLPRWERKLAALVAEIDGHAQPEVFNPDMPFAKGLTDIYTRLLGQRTDRRCGVALAITGTGKSAWGQYMASTHPREVVYVRCDETWRENKPVICRAFASLLGGECTPYTSASTAMGIAKEKLKLAPVTIIVDEAHEGGLMLLKVVKTLIDATMGRFVLLAYPTSWQKMMTASDSARAEAQQLFGRTLKPVFAAYQHGILRGDVAAYLRFAAGLNGDADGVATAILPLVKSNGNLRLLADAVEDAVAQADVSGQPVTGEAIIAHVEALCPAVKGAK